MELCKVTIIKGTLPEWATAAYDGYGYGYGYGDGNGYGYGDGDGYGYGDGDGNGYGDGDGDGYGNGYGYGDGYGDGDGDGDGYGYGDGDGDGDGDGNGYGDGDGDGYGNGNGGPAYWMGVFSNAVKSWTEAQLKNLQEALATASAVAFWKSDTRGLPANGGKSKKPAAPGMTEEIAGPLEICTRNALHATMDPDKWKGDRLWVVALYGDVDWQEDKVGGLKRAIIGEVQL